MVFFLQTFYQHQAFLTEWLCLWSFIHSMLELIFVYCQSNLHLTKNFHKHSLHSFKRGFKARKKMDHVFKVKYIAQSFELYCEFRIIICY